MPTNYTFFTVSMICSLVIIILIISVIVRGKNKASQKPVLLMLLSVLVWSFSYGMFYIVPDIETAIFMHEFQFVGVCFAPVTFLIALMTMTGNERHLKKEHMMLLCVIPILTIILALTNNSHRIFKLYMTIEETSYRIPVYKEGTWFYLHTFYCYVVNFASLAYMVNLIRVSSIRNIPKMCILILALMCPFILNMMLIFGIIKSQYDVTVLGNAIACSVVVWVEFFSEGYGYMALSRDLVFQMLSNPTFILDNNDIIADANKQAHDLVKRINNPWLESYIETPFNTWIEYVNKTRSCSIQKEDGLLQLNVNIDGDAPEIYKLNLSDIINKSGKKLGVCAEFVNVSSEYKLMREIEKLAVTDSLTGLNNRTQYELFLKEHDNENCLPLGIIFIDVNGLKLVNDTLGHEYGDNMLIAVAKVLNTALPENTLTTRIGGDEFAVLLPCTDADIIEEHIKNIEDVCAVTKIHNGETLSIAIGYSIRTTMETTIQETLKTADKNMYKMKNIYYTKHNRRKSR